MVRCYIPLKKSVLSPTTIHERTHIFRMIYVRRSVPPPPEDDTAAGQNNTLVCPQIIRVNLAVIRVEVFHHGYSLPARDRVLRGQWINPTRSKEVVLGVNTQAMDPKGFWSSGVPATVLCSSARVYGLPVGLQPTLECTGPGNFAIRKA